MNVTASLEGGVDPLAAAAVPQSLPPEPSPPARSTAPSSSVFVAENRLPVRFGLPRSLIRKARKEFARDIDWKIVSNRVVWDSRCLQKLAERVSQLAQEARPVAGKGPDSLKTVRPVSEAYSAPLLSEPEEVSAVVVSRPLNRRIVVAMLGVEIVRIRVRDNSHFMKGMECQVRRVEGDIYELCGRAPRYRGKW
jgi:hypothetical protein